MLQQNTCITIYINEIFECKFYGTRLFDYCVLKKVYICVLPFSFIYLACFNYVKWINCLNTISIYFQV